jgi:hypothetical protein
VTSNETRQCLNCEEDLEFGAPPTKKYCSDACRKQFDRALERGTGLTPAKAKELAGKLAFAKMEDVVREVLHEEIRKTITQHVRDNVLGAVEVMSQMLPDALAGLAKDLEDPDPVFRQRAAGMVIKYVMPLANQGDDGEDARIINIIHNVPIPEGNFGDSLAVHVEAIHDTVDAVEDYPECYMCHEPKHPDAGQWNATGFRCRACIIRAQIATPGDNFGMDPSYRLDRGDG